MFKIRTSKYRHIFCDAPKPEVSTDVAVGIGAPAKDVKNVLFPFFLHFAPGETWVHVSSISLFI
jgi:hypothetical protein